jgi:hypothetical protein
MTLKQFSLVRSVRLPLSEDLKGQAGGTLTVRLKPDTPYFWKTPKSDQHRW